MLNQQNPDLNVSPQRFAHASRLLDTVILVLRRDDVEGAGAAPTRLSRTTPGIDFREHGAPPARGTPTPLPGEFADFLTDYAAALEEVPLSADTRRTYVSRVRMYLAWLAWPSAKRRFNGDPLTNPKTRDWAVHGYRLYLLAVCQPGPGCLATE